MLASGRENLLEVFPVDLSRPLSVISPTVDADVLAVLALAEASFTGRQVHHLTGRHSESGVRRALHRLAEQGIVARGRVGSADAYHLNRDHLAAPHIEALARLRTEFLLRVSSAANGWPISAEFVAVFGSAARGDMRADSDIDLFVVRPDPVDGDDVGWRDQLADLAGCVTRWTGNDGRVFELSAAEVRTGLERDEPVLADIREEAIIMAGPRGYLRRASRRTS